MIRLEQLRLEEGHRLRAIRLRALWDAPNAFSSTLEEATARPPETWSKLLRDGPIFVAVRDNVDVGVVRCARDPSNGETAYLMSMWVAPQVRRRGIGTTLVDAVITWARSSGVNRLLLDVADDNVAAIACYAAKGFEPNGKVSTLPSPREHMRDHQRELTLS
jgi:ribosomal protein S18 acetylase RimI-like enzyme